MVTDDKDIECHRCHGVGLINGGGCYQRQCPECGGTGRTTPDCNADEGHPCDAFTAWDDSDPVPCPDCRRHRAAAEADARQALGSLEWHQWNDARLEKLR